MRGTVACIVFSLAAVGVLGGSFYGEKENAIKAVNDKYKALEAYGKNVYNHIKQQQNKTEFETEEKVRKTVENAANTVMFQFGGETMNVTISAMAKGKPLSVIECLVGVVLDGVNGLITTMNGMFKELENIKQRNAENLLKKEIELSLIVSVSHLIKEDTLEKINKATSGFPALQADAINKMETARKQIEQLDSKVMKIDLKNEFLALERQIVPKFKETIAIYIKKLPQCL